MKVNIPKLLFLSFCLATLPVRSEDKIQPSTQSLKATISEVEGVYRWREDLKKYHFSEKKKLGAILEKVKPEEAVIQLVECLDDISPSKSRLDEKSVMVGIICYESLSQLAYYEPTSKELGKKNQWPGDLTPKANAQELAAAKKSWEKVIKAKKHIFL